MTNFEWIWKDNKRSKDLFVHGLAVNEHTGEVARCSSMNCSLCSFNDSKHDGTPCHNLREDWLDMEHESLYKRGDIVIFIPSRCHREETRIGVVKKNNGDGTVLLTWNVCNVERHLDVIDNDLDGIQCNMEDIVRKVGNIKEV